MPHFASSTMGSASRVVITSVFCLILILVVQGDSDPKERVVLVAPVLAPPKGSKVEGRKEGKVVETAKDFPVLMLLSTTNATAVETVAEAKGKQAEQKPIYVEKLEDQKQKLHHRR